MRLIQNYIKIGKLENAVYHWNNISIVFNKETLEKYKSILDMILKENKNFADALEKFKNIGKTTTKAPSKYYMLIGLVMLLLSWLYFKFNPKVPKVEEQPAV